jgi:hypothetical protein
MLKERRMAADQVAAELFQAEAAIDAALNRTAALTAAVPTARVDAGLSALFGQGAIERLSETIAALAQARRGIVECHKELAVIRDQIGLGAVAFGEADKPQGIGTQAVPAVRRVEVAA